MLTLGVSTSTPRGSVALIEGDGLLSRVTYDGGHGEGLFGALDEALRLAGRDKREIGRIGCDVGPGSFTGVRAGVAAMQGVATALAIPCVGVVSLDAMAARGRALGHDRILALLDAKKGEAYYGLYLPDAEPVVSHVSLADPSVLLELVSLHHAVVVGELGALVEGLEAVRDPASDLPDAELVARLATARGAAVGPTATLEPFYVRPPDAKLPRRS